MASKSGSKIGDGTYYVRGSGWVSIAESRVNEIRGLIREYHDQEVDAAHVLMRRRNGV